MNMKHTFSMAVVLLCLITVGPPVYGGSPTESVKQITDKILGIVSNPAYKGTAIAKERKALIRKAVDERFDWEELARRSLGRHWPKRSEEEKKEFIELYGKLLEKTYLERVEGYAGEKVSYLAEHVDGDYATVDMKILNLQNVGIPVQYRLWKKVSDWFVYDISIEGVSLIINYRSQFNEIINRSSYQDLVKRLKEKTAEE